MYVSKPTFVFLITYRVNLSTHRIIRITAHFQRAHSDLDTFHQAPLHFTYHTSVVWQTALVVIRWEWPLILVIWAQTSLHFQWVSSSWSLRVNIRQENLLTLGLFFYSLCPLQGFPIKEWKMKYGGLPKLESNSKRFKFIMTTVAGGFMWAEADCLQTDITSINFGLTFASQDLAQVSVKSCFRSFSIKTTFFSNIYMHMQHQMYMLLCKPHCYKCLYKMNGHIIIFFL